MAPHAGEMKFHTYVQLPNHAFLFLMGGLLARLRAATAWRMPTWAFLLSLGVVLVLGWPRGPRFYDVWEVMGGMARAKYVGLCFLVTAAFAFYEVPRTWLRRGLIELGDASYSVYLLHPFLMHLVSRFMTGWPGLMVGILLTFALASAVYRYMERPAMGLGKRLAGRI
jgi:peptidoglycan/LPS O-acetylase OafA/YrhL